MDLLIILSIISLITTMIGLYMLGEKNPFGFLVFTASLACQMYIFYDQKNWFLFFQMIVLIIFNIINFKKWVLGG